MITLNQGPLALLGLALVMLMLGQQPDRKWGVIAALLIVSAAALAALEATGTVPVVALNAQ